MMTLDWTSRVSGEQCPLCAPRSPSNEHWDFVAALSVSSMYLAKNQTYRGQCQLIFDPRHAARLDQLTVDEWARFAQDLYASQQAVMHVVRPDHVNVESLGNVVPHLHWHVVPRYRDDPHWGAPIWQEPLASMPDRRLGEEERQALILSLRKALITRAG